MVPEIDAVDPAVPQVVRVTPDRRRADEWALVLASAAIDARIEWSLRGYALIVRGDDVAAAMTHLEAYDAENRPAASSGPAEYGPSRAALAGAVLLAAFFVVTGPRGDASVWFERGAAVAARIAAGEWWRTITALTLHADFPHILANAVTMVLFGSALCSALGPGVALALMLLAGAGGNFLAAALRGAPHSAVGASTAIFAALGALAALQMARRRRASAATRWRAWLPLAAGLALLAFLGSSARSDVLAHCFGFALGALLGGVIAVVHPTPPAPRVQRALVAAVVAIMVGCWVIAMAPSQ